MVDTSMTLSMATLTLVVADYDAAITFYCERIGFTLIEDTDLGDGKRWVLIAPDNGKGTRLLLAKAVGAKQSDAVGNQTGGRVMGFLETSNFAAEHARMVSRGINFLEEPRHEAYGWVAVFEDLYGNKWDLIEPKG